MKPGREEKPDKPDITLLIESFLLSLRSERNYSEHSLRAYAGDLKLFKDWLESGELALEDVDSRGMRSFLALLSERGYSKTTVNRRLSAVRTFLQWVSDQDIIEGAVPPIAGPKNPRRLPRVVSNADLEKLLQPSKTGEPVDIRDDAILELMYATGARISELAALRINDIDSTEQLVHYWGKGDKERVVPFHRLALEKINRYLLEARPALIRPDRLRGDGAGKVFIGKSGKPLSADSIRVAFKRRLASVGIDSSVTPHDIRHSFATDLLTHDVDLRSVQEMLGHENLATTQIYTHVSINHLQDTTRRSHPRA